MSEEGRVHPDCRNASIPYHECSNYCFRNIAEAKTWMAPKETEAAQASDDLGQSNSAAVDQDKDLDDGRPDFEEHTENDYDYPVEGDLEGDVTKFTGRKKKLWELRQKMNKARKDNQTDIADEKKRMEAPSESRGISKQKWLEDRKKKIGKLLDANGLEMETAYMLDTQEMAETKYKKWEKDPSPFDIAMIFNLILFSLMASLSSSYGYDPLDPHANITIKWDFVLKTDSSYDITISMHNFQLFRHIEKPGWKLSWTWKEDEVIWNMWGAEATEQGNCSKFIGGGRQIPHCCEKNPTIVDLLPGAPYNMQVSNCCKGGVLTSMVQDYSKSLAAFRMVIGSFSNNSTNINMPSNFSVGLPGYSCGDPIHVPPTKFSHDGGRRFTQALETWNVTCSYSQFRSSPTPKCCVSLSAFYNDTIVPCPQCSCTCQGLPGTKCVKPGETPSLLELSPTPVTQEVPPLVMCSHHMCPIRVHWHVKQSYTEYWRVKITITNLNFVKNYSQWNLVVQHPNLQSMTQVFSFNYHDLNQYGNINDTGMFWGIQYYNDMLLVSGNSGNVQSEILLHKDPGNFTFREGWAFPRRISFNADECVMPLPNDYPRLLNRGHSSTLTPPSLIFSLPVFICIIVILKNH